MTDLECRGGPKNPAHDAQEHNVGSIGELKTVATVNTWNENEKWRANGKDN
jgi:hypothetical protein